MAAQPLEGLVQADAVALGEDALGLLDEDATIEGVLELLCTLLGPRDLAFLQDAGRGHVGERLRESNVVVVEGAWLVAVEVQGTDAVVTQAEREGVGGQQLDLECLVGDLRPPLPLLAQVV